MIGSKKVYYWDSNVYLAWLLEEQTYAQWLPYIREIDNANFRGENLIVTSTLTLAEMFEANLTHDQQAKFVKSLDGYKHKLVDVDPGVARLASTFRMRFTSGAKLLVPDAIHLATAKLHGVDEVHTFDDGRKPGYTQDHEKVKTVSLLSLNGDVKVDALKIIKPHCTLPPPDIFDLPLKKTDEA